MGNVLIGTKGQQEDAQEGRSNVPAITPPIEWKTPEGPVYLLTIGQQFGIPFAIHFLQRALN